MLELYSDNFLTSYDFLEDLAERNLKPIGTVRINRTLVINKKVKTLKDKKRSQWVSIDFFMDNNILQLEGLFSW